MFETSLLFNNLEQSTTKEESPKFWYKLKHFFLPLLILSGVVCVAVGTWLYFKVPEKVFPQDQLLINLDSSSKDTLYIDVSGAVEKPGVYQVSDGARMSSAIDAAGGLNTLADVEYLNSTLNLSARLKDEQKIYIPYVGERKEGIARNQTDSSMLSNVSSVDESLISINTATETELDTLPRVGPATAQKIIAGRPYASIEELVSKKAIGQSVLIEIQSLIKL